MVAMNEDPAQTPPTDQQVPSSPPKKSKASARKRAANRANARKSTGPKTAAGKARSALNAVQHGVLAQTALLPGEDEAELEAMAAEFHDEYAPIGPVETALVRRLVAINWRLRRLAMAEESIAWSRICDRYVHHQQRLQVYEHSSRTRR
jgi:Pyruvate/2-oxoacid:ferredoxin oxidoreductase gamma subunit